MWFWLIGLGCVHEPDVPWLAAARIYGSTDALPPLHSEKSYFFHPFELEHNAKAVLTHPRPEWWDWFPVFRRFSDKPLLDEALIESDALRLKQWFMDNGWLDAEIVKVHDPDVDRPQNFVLGGLGSPRVADASAGRRA